MDKDYRICIVDFDTAVEMAVLTCYQVGALELQGIKASEIEEMLDEDSTKAQKLARKKKGFLTTGSRILRLQENINILREKKKLPIVTFDGAEEHKNWKLLVRKKRNAGVHQWEQFKKEDAEQD